MTDYSRYFDLVTETHVEIEGWFSGLEPGVLPTLLGRFSEQFSMITPSGKELDANAVEALFEQLRGARPGLKITLSDFKGIALYGDGAVVSYRELQEEHNGNRTDRRATVVFEKDASAKVLWRHLHETFSAD
ncbi:DUF4440 domain-containing protein [Pseudomonas paraversuta]|uniref:DUF4440 domain-containing protein n=1 Tax=Pseudomonas TaxID=286 RepID=UPI000287F25E|nr:MULTISPECIES: DUF4440 domain-containing protein [Pseudomonas]AMB80941.1 hypothetical protein AV641_18590 [Pseudomonas fragi]NBF13806.1 DUF4440 domain-containing protein [Pseudomonas sp. Fl4BN2]NNG63274.1 DUF4440 domain-containing protein [Pseudomonas sp. GC01]RUT39077.1 DUF4440 domain-containing protein [Pseudomonas sp. PAMC 29040]